MVLILILGASSVLHRNIFCYYPDCGEKRYKLLFNRLVKPRQQSEKGMDDIHILFCHEGVIKPGETFQTNHFVPLLFHAHKKKCKHAADVQGSKAVKKQKVIPTFILPKTSAGTTDGNILNFFTVAEKQLTNPTFQRAPNESFSSPAALATLPTHNLNVFPKADMPSSSSTNVFAEPDQSTAVFPGTSKPSLTSKMSTEIKHDAINYFDVCLYRERVKGMNTSDICNLIKNVFKPDEHYSFPKSADGRSFRYNWLNMYSWLCYSPSKDGAFCLACVLFGDRFPGRAGKISNLFSKPFTQWSNAAFTFKRHAGHDTGGKMGLHACTFPTLASLLAQMSGAAQPIEVIVDANLKKEIGENRKKLTPIVDSVLFCSRLGLPLRGHRDDAKYHPEVGSYSTGGVGNFIESLNYRVRGGDKVLENHLKTCGKNRSYISKTSQNKIIKCCDQVISEKIISDVKQSKFYLIIADEAADSSHKEQMSLILRFVDTDMNIREEFIAFLQCKWGLSGAQLSKLILESINDLTLSIDDCRGQGYDGAGAVAGHVNGLAAHILRLNKKALYTHCYSHRLNLSVCDSLAIVEVKTMLKHVNEVSHFINISQTRNQPFEDTVKESDTESKKTRLTDVCRTRWVERIEGLDTFQELCVPLYETLNDMSINPRGVSPSLSSDASSHLTRIFKFEFVVALVITRHVLDVTLPVTQLLQGKSIDIMDGIHLINSLKKEIILMRNSVDSYHDLWYGEALQLADQVGIAEDSR